MKAKQQTLLVISITLLPWLGVMLFTGGIRATVLAVAYAVMVLMIGYSVLRATLRTTVRAQNLVLAPALGIVIISAGSALCLRVRFPLTWIPLLWLGLALVGVIGFWLDRRTWMKETVAYGRSLAVLSALICLVYFVPSARNDAVHRPDGSFNWIYVDTQYSHAIAASIKSGEEPPAEPGTYTEELRYHFGPFAPAAITSRVTGLDLGDALARLTRGVSLWSLVLSCFGLGTLLSLKATGRPFGGIMSVAGLFFYGSMLSLFSNEVNSATRASGAILFKIPGAEVLADGGPFSHLLLGHSMLHGLGAATAIMGLCMAQRESPAAPHWRELIALALPALAIPVNSVAGLYSLGIVGTLMFWGRLGKVRSWLGITLMFCLFFTAWTIMGLSHAPDAAGASFKAHIASQWWSVVIGFIVGLGFRIIGFRWISKLSTSKVWSDPVAALVVVTLLGLLSFALLPQLPDSNERYGIYYLQSMFSIFAFSRISPQAWRGSERAGWVTEWLQLARNGMLVLIGAGVLIGIGAYATHTHTGIQSFGSKLAISLALLLLLQCLLMFMNLGSAFASACSAVLACILLVGFFAWITPWLNFGSGRMRMDVTISPAEVQGLEKLRALAAPGERFATNQHALSSLATRPERSYAYSALSERPVLLEGYLYRGLANSPRFSTLLHDNDLIFSTTDPNTVRQIATAYHVRWLVARPGTDISLSRPLPPWLVAEQDCGSLKIYQVK